MAWTGDDPTLTRAGIHIAVDLIVGTNCFSKVWVNAHKKKTHTHTAGTGATSIHLYIVWRVVWWIESWNSSGVRRKLFVYIVDFTISDVFYRKVVSRAPLHAAHGAGESVRSYLWTRIDFKWRLAPGAGLMRFHCFFRFFSLSSRSRGCFITQPTTAAAATTTDPSYGVVVVRARTRKLESKKNNKII